MATCAGRDAWRAWGYMKQSAKKPSSLGETRINQEAIGARLRQLFDDVVNEPVPDEFLDLLRGVDESNPVEDVDLDGKQ